MEEMKGVSVCLRLFCRMGNFVSYTTKASGRVHGVRWTSVLHRPEWNVDCARARRCNMSQATALGARMCRGTFFFTSVRKMLLT